MSDRFKVIVAVHLFLIKDNRILLTRRFNTGWSDGLYSVPAGHVEPGETVTQALIREAEEEVGIEIKSKDLEVAHVMHRLSDSERVDFFLTAQAWTGEPEIKEPDKCDHLRWVSLTKLPKNTIPYIRFALNEIRSGRTYSELGW
jgi:8-oxo-dGTP diphosphatase